MATLSNNDIKIRYDIDLTKLQQAADAFDKITSEERQLLNELGKLKKQFDAAGLSATTAANNAARGMSDIEKATERVGKAIVTYFSVTKIYEFAKSVINTTIQFESLRKAINFTSGSIEAGAANMLFLREASNRLGISLESAASGFKAISASATQAGYSNLQTQKIFENVSKAVAAFGLSSEDASGVFRALSQIISKGTVQAEELRGQIGDRIPGAFSIAAKAMGVTERELNKLMATGKVTAAEFVIPFTEALGKMSEQASTLDSMGKGFQRFQNAWQNMMETLGRQVDENVGIGKFVNAITKSLDFLSGQLKTSMQEQEEAIAKGYQSVMNSEIVTYEKERIERIKQVVIANKEAVKQELENAKAKRLAQQQEIDDLKGFHPFKRRTMKDNLASLDEEIKKLELKNWTLQGDIKAYEELTKVQKNLNEIAADPKELEKQQKALELEYNRKLELLNIDKLITLERIKQTVDPQQQSVANLEAEAANSAEVLKLSKEYGDRGVQAAKDRARTTVAILKTQQQDILAEYDKNSKEIIQSEIDTDQRLYKAALESAERQKKLNDAITKASITDDETEKDILIQNQIAYNNEIIRINEEARKKGIKDAVGVNEQLIEENKRLRAELAKIKKSEVKDTKEAEEEKEKRILATITLTETLFNGVTNLYTANIDKEINALNKRADNEIKLADGNQQKIDEINQKRAVKEKELKEKAWRAERDAAVARVVFETASIVAKWSSSPVTLPLAVLTLANQAAQIGFIMAQKVPEFAEGTKGKPFEGGKAIVGERGVEKVVTQSGKVYFTPPTATLVDLPKGSQVIPNHALSKQELFLASHYANRSSSVSSPVVGELKELGSIIRSLPITQLNMDERGFEKYIRTPRRTTKILNNRFRNAS